ncbi:GntR family transcriptional regulator [Enterococcus avium]
MTQKNESAVEKVISSIRDGIIFKKYSEEEILSENKLSQEYGVSRGSVREALSKIESEGLIETQSNGRRKVIGISEKTIRDAYQARIMIEQQAGKILIDKNHLFDYEPLVNALGKFYTLQYSSKDTIYDDRAVINTNFHRTIVEIADNRILLQCWEVVQPLLHALAKFNYIALGEETDDNVLIDTHSRLVDLIVKKDLALIDEIYKHTKTAIDESIDSYQRVVDGTLTYK